MLNLIYLKYFCDSARLGSISAAASANYVSQSAISQGISKLERSLEKQLLAHHPNRFKLNSDGEKFYQKAQEALDSIGKIEEKLLIEDGEFSGKVNFACMHSFAMAVLPRQIRQVREQYPGIECNFRLGHPGIIKALLMQGALDFGIVLDNGEWDMFGSHKLYEGYYRFFVSSGVKIPEKLPFILSEYRKETDPIEKYYKELMGKEMDLMMRVASWEVMASLVEEGLGIGFFPDFIAEKRKGIFREYSFGIDLIPYRILAIYPKSYPLSRYAQAFLTGLQS